MFKMNETYIISCRDKDMGKVHIYNIVNKNNSKTKKRFHKVNNSYRIIKFIK